MPELWLPGADGPVDQLLDHIRRRIEVFAAEHGDAAVEIQLADGATFAVEALLPEPGYGFLTIRPHGDQPQELIVPVGSLRRIEIGLAEERAGLGFTLPT